MNVEIRKLGIVCEYPWFIPMMSTAAESGMGAGVKN